MFTAEGNWKQTLLTWNWDVVSFLRTTTRADVTRIISISVWCVNVSWCKRVRIVKLYFIDCLGVFLFICFSMHRRMKHRTKKVQICDNNERKVIGVLLLWCIAWQMGKCVCCVVFNNHEKSITINSSPQLNSSIDDSSDFGGGFNWWIIGSCRCSQSSNDGIFTEYVNSPISEISSI